MVPSPGVLAGVLRDKDVFFTSFLVVLLFKDLTTFRVLRDDKSGDWVISTGGTLVAVGNCSVLGSPL